MGFEHGEGYLLKLMLLSRYIAKNLRMLPRPYLTHLYLNNVLRPFYILKTSWMLTHGKEIYRTFRGFMPGYRNK